MLFLVVGNGSVDSSSLARSLSRLSSVHQTSHSSCVFDWRVTHFPCARIHNIFHIASLLLLKFQHFPNWRKRRDRISRRKQKLQVFFSLWFEIVARMRRQSAFDKLYTVEWPHKLNHLFLRWWFWAHCPLDRVRLVAAHHHFSFVLLTCQNADTEWGREWDAT